MLLVIPYWIDWTVPVLVYAFALLKGAAPERILAAICSLSWLHANVLQPYWLGERLPLQLGKDLMLLGVCAALALRFDRWWLLVASAATLVKVATDIAAMLVHLHGWAFGTAMWTWNWIFLAALTIGAWRSWRVKLNPAGG